MHSYDDEFVFGHVFQVLFQPCHLRLGDFGGVVGRAGVEHVVEHDEVAVADVVRIIGGAERRTETVVGLRVHADGLVVVVVADHLEDGYADLPDLLLVDAVERHVVPHQVAQRNAVDRFVQLLYVGHQQGQHLFFEHHDLVVAADLHVSQRQQGEPGHLAGLFFIHNRLGVKVFDLSGQLALEFAGVKLGDGPNAALACFGSGPALGGGVAQRVHGAKARNHDSAFFHKRIYPFTLPCRRLHRAPAR